MRRLRSCATLATLLARFDAGEIKPGQLESFARSLAGRDE